MFLGTLNMLGLARRTNAKLLLASTSEVYGDPNIHPQPENYRGNVNPIGIRSCYDEGKRIAETLCFDYLRKNNTDIKIMRIFNTYGPRMLPDDGRVVSNFILQALKGKSLTINGNGEQTRSFCFVDDLIQYDIFYSSHNGPINFGNPNEITIRKLAELIIKKIDPNLSISFKPLPEDDPLKRKPLIDLANKELNWQPQVNINEGLDKTIEYFKKCIK